MLHMICVSDIYWCNMNIVFVFSILLDFAKSKSCGAPSNIPYIQQNSKPNYGDPAQYGLTHGRPNVKGKVR